MTEELHFIFRLLALSQVMLLTIYLIIYQRHALGLLAALTIFSFGCYLMAPFSQYSGLTGKLIILISNAVPSILWLLGWFFFYDDRKIPVWFWLLSITYLALGLPDWPGIFQNNTALAAFNLAGSLESEATNFIFDLMPQLIKLVLVLQVIYMALDGRTMDLVAQRLKLRVPFAAGGATLASLIIIVEIWSAGNSSLTIEIAGSLLMFVICLTSNLYLFNLRDDLPLNLNQPVVESAATGPHISNQADQQPCPTKVQAPDLEPQILKIQTAMTEQRFYAVHGATIGDLAEHLGIAEYRLRAIINQQLGYRNFNQFLNEHRIKEATSRLISEAKLPILSIALDVGFKSLSSFNKAFKDKHTCTPSEYRSNTLYANDASRTGK